MAVSNKRLPTTTQSYPASPSLDGLQTNGATLSKRYSVSPSLDGLQIPDLPITDPIINSKYAYTTKSVSPPSRSLEKPGFLYDRQNQNLSPHRPPSSYGPSPQNSPELTSADTFRYSPSPRSSPVPPPSSRLSSAPSPQGSCSELILPQPALDYVVANM